MDLIKAAKKRGIKVTIYYGYSNLEINQKDDNDQQLVQEYIKALGSDNVIRIPQGTHEKVLLVDDRLLVIGSWNWLSNAYYKWYETQNTTQTNLAIRRETSIIIMDRKIITDYKANNLLNVI
ncbi:phospholipase D-like domain-containing protein [Acinetobacter baumannii]|uniref:phospholipase D-like domain-containing protein n=1 Tax=Acinetobacter baumannii TaxID=470 RepID=UPI0037BE65C5